MGPEVGNVFHSNSYIQIVYTIGSTMRHYGPDLQKLDRNKCKHMHLGKEAETSYTLSQTNIKSTNLEKDLGFIIDNKLTFSDHTDSKVRKAKQMIGIIKRTFSHMDKDMLTILCKSLIRPHLEHGNPTW